MSWAEESVQIGGHLAYSNSVGAWGDWKGKYNVTHYFPTYTCMA